MPGLSACLSPHLTLLSACPHTSMLAGVLVAQETMWERWTMTGQRVAVVVVQTGSQLKCPFSQGAHSGRSISLNASPGAE